MSEAELLRALRDQLTFFESGGYGYSYRSSWRPTLVIRDSPICLNAIFTTAKPCRECILFSMIPAEKRNSLVPCHHIPLNAAGETLATLYEKGSQQKLDETFHHWLRATIQTLEEERGVTPMKALECSTAISFKNILFLTDFSPASEAAFTYAVAIARHFQSRVYPAHVVVPPIPTEVEAPVALELLQQAEDDSRRKLVDLFKDTGVAYQALVSQVMIESVVPDWVEKHGIDLIVVGTHARKGVDRFLIGSTAEMIFRTASCPVLTVGPHVPPRSFGKLEINKVLCAVGLSKETEPAVPYAVSFAQERHAELTFLHVITDEVETNPEPGIVADYAREKMNKLVPLDVELPGKPQFLVAEGDPAKQIISRAGLECADLIVLGVSNEKKPSTHFGRGVAYKVISSAPCAVLTVR